MKNLSTLGLADCRISALTVPRVTRRFLACCLAVLAMLASRPAVAAAEQGSATSLTIDVQDRGAVLSPLLFGHNLEHTRRAIWQGLSAEMMANRKFAAVDGGLPKRWSTMDGSRVAMSL